MSSSAAQALAMLVPLTDVLAMPSLHAAAPQVLTGDAERCAVRWVHSSEVFEMGPLISGQELLLTTGLGLRGTSAPALGRYVDALADSGLAALGIELGRTFSEVPTALVEAARRRDLVLIALTRVVPFERIVEAFHELVMQRERSSLPLADRAWRELVDLVLEGHGIRRLVERIADLAGAEAYVLAPDGRVVAASHPGGAPDPGARESRAVVVGGAPWGTLVLAGGAPRMRASVLERGVRVLALELVRTGVGLDAATTSSTLFRDLLDETAPSDLRGRLEVAGLPTEEGRALAGLCVSTDRRTDPAALAGAAYRACRARLGACVVGRVDDDVLLVVRVPRERDALLPALAEVAAAVGNALDTGSGPAAVTVAPGHETDRLDGLGASLRQAREQAAIARRLGIRRPVLAPREFAVYRLLSRLGDGPEVTELVRDQLGALLDHDAGRSADLVVTLEAYLRNGTSKATTATELGISRQTLYNRLSRIERVLGPDALAGHDSRTALSLALHAWRLTAGLPEPGRGSHTGP